jgi:transcription-repair coupling factor (superfamily II helicase)
MTLLTTQTDTLEGISNHLAQSSRTLRCTGGGGSERALLVADMYRRSPAPVVVITAGPKEAERFSEDLRYFLAGRVPVWYFPPYNLQPYKMVSYNTATTAERLGILFRITQAAGAPLVVTTVGAVTQRLIPKQELVDFSELVMAGEDVDREALVEKILSGGYARTAIVEEPGDFSIRGGILDIFSPLYDDPLRIEFFGDTVDAIRHFSAASQRKITEVDEAIILPAREAILRPTDLTDFLKRIRTRAADMQLPVAQIRSLVDRIRGEGIFPGIESLISLVFPKLDTFMDYVPAAGRFVLVEPAGLAASADDVAALAEDHYRRACEEQRLCVPPGDLYTSWPVLEKSLEPRTWICLEALPVARGGEPALAARPETIHMDVTDNAGLSVALKNRTDRDQILAPLAEWIAANKGDGRLVLMVCRTRTQAERLRDLLKPYGIAPNLVEGAPELKRNQGLVYISVGRLSTGFVWGMENLAILTDDEIFGEKRRRRTGKRSATREELLSLDDLKTGDLVVHVDHGIGQYRGLNKLTLNGVTNDFLLITYKDDDKLYLPVDRMNMARKYVGVDGIGPVLDKMGGKSWERTKRNAEKEVEKIAGELLDLYAARKARSGHAFGAADSYFQDFETGFVYEETHDQLRAIEDVLEDMESTISMDRLVCGDVGYGKTEVALRAAFKAVSDSKQVAVLVPTTVLAEQHFQTFSDRFRRYPVNLACLNRFRSPVEQRRIIDSMKNGRVDIVIGTHRLLQKDVAFKDLGLIVLDEEQRFGVKHKEKLKQLRSTVDVLALTATPIPRTLHMSLMGVRDISVISTPPEQRHPIVTYLSEYDDRVIADAIRKELKRNGQIFFVHNNIRSIDNVAAHLKGLVPGVKLAVAHGRQTEYQLENVMLQFISRKIDMLVCTTIIESGLDIPAANTILINRADRFGLSQIYQLRGRVGRADEQAYAYLFIPKDSVLGRDAQKRLKVLMEHSALGAGFQIAMSDLQIRGGGDALGVSQSGHIAAVGYDMFLQLLENAVSELKGEPVQEPLEPEININLSAFVPETYIPDIDQRLAVYRRLAKMETVQEIADLKAEMTDRFGALPSEATNLLFKIMLKILSRKSGIKRLDLAGSSLVLHFSATHQKNPLGVIDMIADEPARYRFRPDNTLRVVLTSAQPTSALGETKNILKEISRRVNSVKV